MVTFTEREHTVASLMKSTMNGHRADDKANIDDPPVGISTDENTATNISIDENERTIVQVLLMVMVSKF